MRNFHCVGGNTVYFESTQCLVQDELHQFIDTLEIGLIDLNRAISDTYFLANVSSA